MSEITLYVVVDDDEETIAFDEGTFAYADARDVARAMGGAVLAREYVYDDSSVVADFREPGKRAIGFEDHSE